jgi:hypothetical protein
MKSTYPSVQALAKGYGQKNTRAGRESSTGFKGVRWLRLGKWFPRDRSFAAHF